MGSKIFNYENPLWQFMARVWDLMILNVLCILCCLPVITAGASITALYYVTLKMAENRESQIYRSFFKAFKQNFVQSTIIEIILAVLGVALWLDIWFFLLGGQSITAGTFLSTTPAKLVIYVVLLMLLMICLLLASYVFAVQARFSNPIGRTINNSLLMSLRHLPVTVSMIFLNVIFYFLLLSYFSWLVFWFIAAPVYINSLFLCKVFRKYMPEEDEDE